MKLRKLYLIALTALLLVTLAVVGCGEDESPTAPPAPEDDAAFWCNVDACAANETLRNECTEEFNRCVASGGQSNDCGAAARISTCSAI